MKTFVFFLATLLQALSPALNAPLKDSEVAELEPPNDGVHNHEDPVRDGKNHEDQVRDGKWSFSFNPGPISISDHSFAGEYGELSVGHFANVENIEGDQITEHVEHVENVETIERNQITEIKENVDNVDNVENVEIKATTSGLSAAAVDGGWSDWGEYGECSEECGGGKQTRTRTCTNPIPQHGGRTCEQQNIGDNTETKDCNLHVCAIDGGWTSFGACTKTCEGGLQTRTCTNPPPEIGGQHCIGEASQSCNEGVECPPVCTADAVNQDACFCQNGQGGEACNAGQHCNSDGSCLNVCTADAVNQDACFCQNGQGEACNAGQHCNSDGTCLNAVDGGWSDWGEYGECSEECGGGKQTRTRTCTNPIPQHGGRTCEQHNIGDNTETKDCNLHVCATDGGWSEWSEFSACSACGSSTQRRERTCTEPEPANGGDECPGSNQDTVDCPAVPDCATDGGWSEWSEFSACSACGSSPQKRERTCTEPEPANGGDECPGPNQDTVDCPAVPDCVLVIISLNNAGDVSTTTLSLPDFTPVESECLVPDPGHNPKDRSISPIFQEFRGTIYWCTHEMCRSYDEDQNNWKTMNEAKFISMRHKATGTVIGDQWIVLGGSTLGRSEGRVELKTTEVWSPGTGNWEEDLDRKAKLPVTRSCFVNLNGKLMQIGGWSYSLRTPGLPFGESTRKVFLDGQEVKSLNMDRTFPACAVIDGQVWVAGGKTEDKTVVIYDPVTDTWNEGPKLPHENHFDEKPQLVKHLGDVYYIGGTQIFKIYKLNEKKDSWDAVGDIERVWKQKLGSFIIKKPC